MVFVVNFRTITFVNFFSPSWFCSKISFKNDICYYCSLSKGIYIWIDVHMPQELKRLNYKRKKNLFPFFLPVEFIYNFFLFALCSRNFQNVKLVLDFVDIWSFYHLSDLTWNPILAHLNGDKMWFLAILETLNF